ncbi:MAG: pantetheine-phosphate adenylyltransferase [Candidatus Sumerlaeia bacterium]
MKDRAPIVALYPGSFDGLTNGHLDIIERASRLFDKVIVAVALNVQKRGWFPMEVRCAMIEAATRHLPNVEIAQLDTLTVKFAQKVGASFIVRGLRAVSDFEYELQLALMNREMSSSVETIFLAPSKENIFLSTSIVKEVFRHGGDISPFVPPEVLSFFERFRDSLLSAGTDAFSDQSPV